MFFNVGPYRYRLAISDRPIYDAEGNQLEGLAVEQRRLLIVSYRVEPDRREEVALHELGHAWLFHFPTPRTDEERCQFFAATARQFRMDLEEQGGAEAMLQMAPERVPHLSRGVPSSAQPIKLPESFGLTDRVVCGCCGAEIMCGEIRHAEPRQHEYTGQWQVERWADCEACGTLQVWLEYCAPDGRPTGTFVSVPPPRMLRGREAALWRAGRGLQQV